MKNSNRVLAGSLLALATSAAVAGTQPYFTPLTQSSAVATPDHVNELNSPWQSPAGISQVNLTSMREIEADMDQSVVRVEGLGTNASMWDMVAFDPTGEYIFIPHETDGGAGLTRYSIADDEAHVLFSGDGTKNWESDWGAFDPARFTPYGTVIMGEEWSGQGRVMEVLNPYANPADIEVSEKVSFANVSHEGISFGVVNTNTAYYVDENHSGAIYKLVSSDANFNDGDTYVLVVDGFDGDPGANWDDGDNATATRTGAAHWKLIARGRQMVEGIETNAFWNGLGPSAGRGAADEAGAAPFGRPEDTEIGTLANGNEVLYFTATAEQSVYSVEMLGGEEAIVRVLASESDTPKNAGFLPTTGVINSPDNLAQDALGNIYIIEDAPNGSDVGGDVWFIRDADNDGEAESVDHFLSIQVDGAEATGMIFNPVKPTQFVITSQHPDSTGISEGYGDALWQFDVTGVVPPVCEQGNRMNEVSFGKSGKVIRTCSQANDASFVRELEKAAR